MADGAPSVGAVGARERLAPAWTTSEAPRLDADGNTVRVRHWTTQQGCGSDAMRLPCAAAAEETTTAAWRSEEEQGGTGTCAEAGKRMSYGCVACVLCYKGSELLVRRRKNATKTSQDRQREALSYRFSLLRSGSLLARGCFFLVLLCLRAFLVGDSLPRILSPLIASCPLDLLRLGGAGSGRRHLDKIIILMDKGDSGYWA